MGIHKPVSQAPQWLQEKVLASHSPDTRHSQTLAIYTILTILMRMKSDFGFEAMLEYMDKYLRALETHTPEIRMAVVRALEVVNLHRIYKEVDPHA